MVRSVELRYNAGSIPATTVYRRKFYLNCVSRTRPQREMANTLGEMDSPDWCVQLRWYG